MTRKWFFLLSALLLLSSPALAAKGEKGDWELGPYVGAGFPDDYNLAHPEKGKDARKYVAERKLSDESVKSWQIGLALGADNDLLSAARQKKIPDKLLLAAGLVVGAGSSLSDKFVNRLMFTIADVTGRIIAFGGRTL